MSSSNGFANARATGRPSAFAARPKTATSIESKFKAFGPPPARTAPPPPTPTLAPPPPTRFDLSDQLVVATPANLQTPQPTLAVSSVQPPQKEEEDDEAEEDEEEEVKAGSSAQPPPADLPLLAKPSFQPTAPFKPFAAPPPPPALAPLPPLAPPAALRVPPPTPLPAPPAVASRPSPLPFATASQRPELARSTSPPPTTALATRAKEPAQQQLPNATPRPHDMLPDVTFWACDAALPPGTDLTFAVLFAGGNGSITQAFVKHDRLAARGGKAPCADFLQPLLSSSAYRNVRYALNHKDEGTPFRILNVGRSITASELRDKAKKAQRRNRGGLSWFEVVFGPDEATEEEEEETKGSGELFHNSDTQVALVLVYVVRADDEEAQTIRARLERLPHYSQVQLRQDLLLQRVVASLLSSSR